MKVGDRAGGGASRRDAGFGAVAVLFAALALVVWFPADIRGGFTERGVGGDPAPGDAFFPTLLAWGILLLGLAQCVGALARGRAGAPAQDGAAGADGLTRRNLGFIAAFAALFALSITLMAWTGPLLADLFSARSYRQLSDTAPWKYAGFVLGGLLLALAPIAAIERGLRWRSVLIVAAALAVLILLVDVLLSGVRLPPNADV